jgi:hypothetical protein
MHTGCMLGYSWSHNTKTEAEELYYYLIQGVFLVPLSKSLAKKLYYYLMQRVFLVPFYYKTMAVNHANLYVGPLGALANSRTI